jgi:hypothetical protein
MYKTECLKLFCLSLKKCNDAYLLFEPNFLLCNLSVIMCRRMQFWTQYPDISVTFKVLNFNSIKVSANFL